MKKTADVIREAQYPTLVRAVIRQLGGVDSLEDVANHGKDDILALAKQEADNEGSTMLQLVASFNTFHGDYTVDEIAEGIYHNYSENADMIQNALAWFALEEVARMFEE